MDFKAATVAFGMFAAVAAPASAQPAPQQIRVEITPIPAPAEPGAIPLDTGSVPGMPPESWFADRGQRVVRNVSRATLTPFLPTNGTATGAAVIIAPGGGFAQLSMDNEGWPVARWLAVHGIAAFVLKYRLRSTPSSPEAFKRELQAKIAEAMGGKLDLSTPPQALQDARAAMRLVRARSREWGVDPDRVGVLGFSAGAMTALSLTLSARGDDMPSFVAPIYGPMVAVAVPANAPPMFAALAADDPLFGKQGFGLVESWQRAHKPVELHFFQSGSHGFGMGQRGTTTVDWIESFRRWLDANGLLARRSDAVAPGRAR